MPEHAAERLIDDLCTRLPGFERAFAGQLLGEAAHEFARLSTVWRELIEETTDSEGLSVGYTPSQGMVLFVAGVLDRDGRPYRAWWQAGEEIRFRSPLPDTDLLIELVLVPEPGRSPDEMPDDFLRLHYPSLLEGALAYAYEQPAKPWSSLELHKAHRRRFIKLCGRGRHQAQTYGNSLRGQVRIPYFGVERQGFHG